MPLVLFNDRMVQTNCRGRQAPTGGSVGPMRNSQLISEPPVIKKDPLIIQLLLLRIITYK